MIYRITTGAQSEWKKRVISSALVLAVTIGFPVLGAWLNYEAFTPSASDIAQDDNPGTVLGDSTENEAAAHTANPPVSVNPTPVAKPLTVKRRNPVVPQTPIPEPVVSVTPPASQTPAASVTAPNDTESNPTLEVEVLDVIDGSVEVTPPPVVEPVLDPLGL